MFFFISFDTNLIKLVLVKDNYKLLCSSLSLYEIYKVTKTKQMPNFT